MSDDDFLRINGYALNHNMRGSRQKGKLVHLRFWFLIFWKSTDALNYNMRGSWQKGKIT